MICRQILCCFTLLLFFATGAFAQSDSPAALRSAARALTVGELSGVVERAESGDIHSQILLGLSLSRIAGHTDFADKEGQARMYRAALYWLRKAANKGSAPAQYFLAMTDVDVMSTQTPNLANFHEIIPLLRKAMSQDYAAAMIAVGRCYLGDMPGDCDARGVNLARGLKLFKKAYSAGDPEAAYRIGMAYDGDGRGNQRDLRKADRWFLRGARLGDPSSEDAIGVNLAEGIGTGKNVQEAVEWFRKSAEQGNTYGACNLALHFMRGEGVAKDLVVALKWVMISDQVNETGYLCGEEIAGPFLKLTPAQWAEATHQANAWLKQHNYPPAEPPDLNSLSKTPHDRE